MIDSSVGSTNALTLATVGICEAARSSFSFDKNEFCPPNASYCQQDSGRFSICGAPVLTRLEAAPQSAAFAGKLKDRLRADAHHAFVIVTDDNSNTIFVPNDQFLKEASSVPGMGTHVFAFRAFQKGPSSKGGGGCTGAAFGTNYEELAKLTGGKTFDICEPDWSANFKA
ncbi:MAG: hypothetical protein EOP04_11650, partial [Proteobacteria bacterium]